MMIFLETHQGPTVLRQREHARCRPLSVRSDVYGWSGGNRPLIGTDLTMDVFVSAR
jgi:hypothetical protein